MTMLGAALVALTAAQAPAAEPVRIVMSRTACFGSCPVYTVSMSADGAVRFDGLRDVRVSGTHEWKIDAASVEALAADMEQAGFFAMRSEYSGNVTDLPTTIVTLTRASRTKTVKDYVGAPGALKELEARIDRVSGAKGLVSIDAAAIRDLVAHGWQPIGDEAARWMDRALYSGDARTVTALFDAGMDPRAADGRGVTLVMKAATSGDPDTVRAVVAAGGDKTARDFSGRNAADRVRDAMDPRMPQLFPYVEATGRPRDYPAILRLLTDE